MPTPHPLADAAADRAARRERDAEAEDALGRVHSVHGLHAATLALIAADGVGAELAWRVATREMPQAALLRSHALALAPNARLPWLERLAERMRRQPIAARRDFLVSTRRVISAGGSVAPLARLQWLALRRWFGESGPTAWAATANGDFDALTAVDVRAVARYSAFLSRLVPGAGVDAGRRWYDAVTLPWHDQAAATFEAPDADAMATALLTLQSFGWMLRPMLLRAWVDAALAVSPPPIEASGLRDGAADALRLSAALLDSPLPPALARHHRILPPESGA